MGRHAWGTRQGVVTFDGEAALVNATTPISSVPQGGFGDPVRALDRVARAGEVLQIQSPLTQ